MDLHTLFPDMISLDTANKCRGFPTNKPNPKIIVNVEFNNTWMQPPKPLHDSDSVGTWPENVKFPVIDKYFIPPKGDEDLPKKLPILIQDETMRAFLEGGSIMESEKARLPVEGFEPPLMFVNANKKFHVFDSWARKGLTEVLTVDTLLGAELDLLKDVKEDWDNMNDENKLQSVFSGLENLCTLAHTANYRAQQYLTSVFVTNKLLIRDCLE